MKRLPSPLMGLLSIGAALAVLPQRASAQGTLSGQVVVQEGRQAVPLATVMVLGTTLEAQTDATGRYTLRDVPAGPVALMVRSIGYRPEQRTVPGTSGRPALRNFS